MNTITSKYFKIKKNPLKMKKRYIFANESRPTTKSAKIELLYTIISKKCEKAFVENTQLKILGMSNPHKVLFLSFLKPL